MLAPLGAGVTLTIHRRTVTGPDAYGNDSWTFVDEVVDGCGYWPGSAGRNIAGSRDMGAEEFRSQIITTAQVVLPDGKAIAPADELTTPDGHRWRVSAEGQQWFSQLTGSSSGIQVGIQRVEG